MLDPDLPYRVYLHFFDRELNLATGKLLSSERIVRATRALALTQTSDLYCGLSAPWENPSFDGRTLGDIELLLAAGVLQPVSHDSNLGSFLESRQRAYAHDRARYPRYFQPSLAIPWLQPLWLKQSGSTMPLVRSLGAWSAEVSQHRGTLTYQQIAPIVQSTLRRREDQAVTFSLFAHPLTTLGHSEFVEGIVRTQISMGFTKDYLEQFEGDIATGIAGLGSFDSLSRSFPLVDLPMLGALLAFCGLDVLLDVDQWPVDNWSTYVWARQSQEWLNFATGLRWLLLSLSQARRALPLRPDEAPGDREHQGLTRSWMRDVVSTKARLVRHLNSPSPGVDKPQDVFVRSLAQIQWLANELVDVVPTLSYQLERNIHMMELQSCDVLLVTVTDIETQTLTRMLEDKVGPGQQVLGGSSVYWDYGPVGGVRISLLRTRMGAGGSGGTALSVSDALRDRRPAMVISVGIAFALSDKQKIGEVLVSERVVNYEAQRVGEDLFGGTVTIHRGGKHDASPRLISHFRDSRLDEQGLAIRVGEILSGDKLVDNLEFRNQLKKSFPDAIGGEMEASAVQAACDRERVDWVIVKAVCDHGHDKGKNKRHRQQIASEAASAAVLHVLMRGGLAGIRRR